MRLYEITDEPTPAEPEQELVPAYKDTAEIKASVWPALQQRIAKLNRKATRLQVPPVTLTVVREFLVKAKKHEHDEDPREEKWYEVKVEGNAPQVAGYKFMATIQHKDAGNIIRTVPGEENNPEIPRFYEARPDYCDHCHKRRNRVDTFIVRGEDGQLRQIGRNCLADFLGGMDPKRILWYFSLRDLFQRAVSDAEEETSRRNRRGEYAATPQTVLQTAALLIRELGYRKASEARDEGGRMPTSQMVRYALFTREEKSDSKEQKQIKALVKAGPTPEDLENVKKAVEWFNSIPQEEKTRSEFFHNIDVLLRSETVSPRDVGFLGAIFPSYHRATIMAKERAAQSTKKNETVGAVGQKLPPTQVTVARTQNISGQFGTTQMCFMEDADGRLFLWFNNSKSQLEQGQNIIITGTIKKHDDYKGRKQTVLTRVKAQQAP